MTDPHNLPDYKERYFETKALDHIHGKSTLQLITESAVNEGGLVPSSANSLLPTLGFG